MTGPDELDNAWRLHRRRVLDVAYRMLGSVTEAEDVAQEAFARLMVADIDAIDDQRGWLVTVTTRLCLDHLRSAAVRRRAYLGPWCPEPVVDLPDPSSDPADRITLDASVRMALLVVLERLSPAERTAFVLHDVFRIPFGEVAEMVGRSPAACRQLASRARRRVREAAPDWNQARSDREGGAHRRVADRFAAACNDGDLVALAAVLDPDVVGEFDSGGVIAGAPTEPVTGAASVARLLLGAFARRHARFVVAGVNGEPGVVVTVAGRVVTVASLVTEGDRVLHVRAVGNPAKLASLRGRSPDDEA